MTKICQAYYRVCTAANDPYGGVASRKIGLDGTGQA